jgi:nicotinate-nucleotide pyrophosphorylase (carboxylating)
LKDNSFGRKLDSITTFFHGLRTRLSATAGFFFFTKDKPFFLNCAMFYLQPEHIKAFIQQALQEDLGSGDHSSLSTIPLGTKSRAKALIKEDGVLAGVDLALAIFKEVDPYLDVTVYLNDGADVKKGDIVFIVEGSVHAILAAERLVLNCMQRMSGIATYTKHLVSLISHTGAKLLDTRKTTPNFRIAEKWAVKIGGGENHRFALYDMIMIKDNHVDYAGGITKAIRNAKDYLAKEGLPLDIEVETRNLEEVSEALAEGGIRRIMFDNFPLELLKAGVQLVNKAVETEASGGINESSIVSIAETGVDYISVGALTHHVRSIDISLKAY